MTFFAPNRGKESTDSDKPLPPRIRPINSGTHWNQLRSLSLWKDFIPSPREIAASPLPSALEEEEGSHQEHRHQKPDFFFFFDFAAARENLDPRQVQLPPPPTTSSSSFFFFSSSRPLLFSPLPVPFQIASGSPLPPTRGARGGLAGYTRRGGRGTLGGEDVCQIGSDSIWWLSLFFRTLLSSHGRILRFGGQSSFVREIEISRSVIGQMRELEKP